MRKILFILLMASITIAVNAQPAARRAEQQKKEAPKSNSNNLTTRAQLSFPTAVTMAEDVVWRRDIYRKVDLMKSENSGLYYPVEPVGDRQNLFTYIFKLMLTGKIKVYEYRLDGNELFSDSARVKPMDFLKNYEIYYTLNGRSLHIDNSDIPSAQVTSYFIKECAYYDQANATFHKKVLALCPVMKKQDDFGDFENTYPLFWVKYDDLAPFLAKQEIMTSDLNNAAVMSLSDFFDKNHYKGDIYKTNNMLGRSLMQYCHTDEELTAEQARIEKEITDFEESIFKSKREQSAVETDSASVDEKETKAKAKPAKEKTTKTKTTTTKKTTAKTQKPSKRSSGSSSARVSVRRERH